MIYGIAISPHAEAILRRHEQTDNMLTNHALPRIIDPRLTVERNEVYYDRETWVARVKEQNEWDTENFCPCKTYEPKRSS